MRLRPGKRFESGLYLLVLAGLAAAALWPSLTQGKAPCDTSGIFFYPPWEEARPAGLLPPASSEAGASEAGVETQRFYPWYAFLSHAGHTRDSILWSPMEGCGTPFLAVWRTRALSPFSLPFYLLPMDAAIPLSGFLKLVVAGWAAFFVMRRLGFAAPLALAASVAFEFSGPVFSWLCWPISDAIAWFPILYLAVERLASGQLRWWPVASVAIGLMALGGDPETLGGAVIFSGLYIAFRLAGERSGMSASLWTFGASLAALVFGLLLVAMQVVPYIEFLSQAASTGHDPSTTTLRLRDLVVAFFPGFFGSSAGVVTEEGALRSVQVVRLLYVGLIQVWLLTVWLSLRAVVDKGHRRPIESLLLCSLAMTVLAMLAGRALGRLPLLHLLGPEHFLAFNAFAFAVTSVAAADAWLALDPEECRRAIKRLVVYVPLLAVLASVCVFVYRNAPRTGASPLGLQIAAAAVLSAALLVLLAYTVPRPSPRVMGYGLATLTFVSLFLGFWPGVKYESGDRIFPETSFITSLKSMGERVSGSTALAGWPLAGNLIPQVYSPSGIVLARHAAFLERLKADPLLLRRMGAPALLLTREDIQASFAGIRSMLTIQRVFPSGAVVFGDLDMKPRAWVAPDWRPVKEFVPADLSSGAPPLVEAALTPANGPPGPASTAVIQESESSARVRINVDGPRPGILILADAHYPGWKAAIDGEKAEILRVDGMFRGVAVKAGPHEVAFRYAPFSVRLGLYITLGAAVVVLFELRRVFRQY